MKKFVTFAVSMGLCLMMAAPTWGHEEHEHNHTKDHGRTVRILHFAHPLIGEPPTPDRKIRPDWIFQNGDEEDVHTANLELEYLLTPGVSVEADIPYTFRDPDQGPSVDNLDNISAELKIANPWFSGHNLLLVHGLGVGLPTGDDDVGIGSNNIVEYEFVNGFGYKPWPGWELTGFAELGIPTNQGPGDEIETELGWNLSLLKHITPRWQGLVELDGETVLSAEEAEEDGRDVFNLSPGVKYRLDAASGHAPSHWMGLSAGFPISGPEEFVSRWKVSYFYHF